MEQRKTERVVSEERIRTNLLQKSEQRLLDRFVSIIPDWLSSDMLTLIGLLGSIIILSGFILGTFLNRTYLLLGISGFVINWFGDSLDGKIAYYRRRIRKWYGFSLDLTADWVGVILIGLGVFIYLEGIWKILGFGVVALYGWLIIIILLRYKITGDFLLDIGLIGPTEMKILASIALIGELFLKGILNYFLTLSCFTLLSLNVYLTLRLYLLAQVRDIAEKEKRVNGNK